MYKVREIYDKLEQKPKELLTNPERQLLKEGDVYLYNPVERKRKFRHIFLFNDVMLVCKPLVSKYRLRVFVTLREELVITDVPDSADACEFRLMAPTKSFVFFGVRPLPRSYIRSPPLRTQMDPFDKKRWIQWISNAIHKRPVDWTPSASADGKAAKKAAAAGKGKGKKGKKGKEVVEKSESESESEEAKASDGSDSEDEDSDESADHLKKEAQGGDDGDDDDDDDSSDKEKNPDADSFVPVLPGQFFTPSSARKGSRAGKERDPVKPRRKSSAAAKRSSKSGGGKKAEQKERRSSKKAEAQPQVDLLGLDDLTAPAPAQPQQQAQQGEFGDILSLFSSAAGAPAGGGAAAPAGGGAAINPFDMPLNPQPAQQAAPAGFQKQAPGLTSQQQQAAATGFNPFL